jgi:hypothetical protein
MTADPRVTRPVLGPQTRAQPAQSNRKLDSFRVYQLRLAGWRSLSWSEAAFDLTLDFGNC